MKNNCPKVYSVYNNNSLDQLDYLESRFKTLNIPFHFNEIELEDDGISSYGTKNYSELLYKRCFYYFDTISSLPDNELVIFSDLDVQPFKNYSELVGYMDSFDLVFMNEFAKNPKTVNCGLFLLRKTNLTMDIFSQWKENSIDRFAKSPNNYNDQPVMQGLLNSKKRLFKTFDHSIVSRNPNLIYQKSIAYHAIGKPHDKKIEFMKQSLENYKSKL